jgi:hypothetical protein
MFARRTAGSAGRSGDASAEWKNMPTAGQGTGWVAGESRTMRAGTPSVRHALTFASS